jgi:hypothetical protein
MIHLSLRLMQVFQVMILQFVILLDSDSAQKAEAADDFWWLRSDVSFQYRV